LSGQYSAYWSLIKYYENEALPLADKQIKASWLAYKLGNISYFQFIQNVEAAVSVKQEYLKQEELLYELSVKIKYLTGN
jgi:cobalt-zinc-cadmium resistance protein CzcA